MFPKRFLYAPDNADSGGSDELQINDELEGIEGVPDEDVESDTDQDKEPQNEDDNEEGEEVVEPSEVEKLREENAKLKSTKEKMSSDYKRVESERNKFERTFGKFGKALKEQGVAEIDEDYNLIIKQQKEDKAAAKSEMDILNDNIKDLKSKYKEGDITEEEYFDKLTDYKAIKVKHELKKEQAEQQIIEQESKKKNEKVEKKNLTNEGYFSKLNSEFAGHGLGDSELYKEMEKVYAADPELFENPNSNYRERYLLAKLASKNLNNTKAADPKTTKPKTDNRFKTTDSGMYDKNSKSANKLSNEHESIMIKNDFNPKQIARLKKTNFVSNMKKFEDSNYSRLELD